jgi:aspartate aminotransferase
MPTQLELSANVSFLRESETIAVSQKARSLRAEGRRILDLGAGEPDFATPEFIRQAAKAALDKGATRYTAVEGILPLREAIARTASEGIPGPPVEAGEVIVSAGSKQALFNACFVLFGPGDEVLVPTPAWTSYYEMIALARARPVEVQGRVELGFKVTALDLERAATSATRGVVLNSPCNPTGSLYTSEELREIATLARERGWWVISDEIYRRISYSAPAPSILEVAPARDNLVVVNGVAKAYAMTGWRIGWAIAAPEVVRAMRALQSHTTSNPATVSQYAALAALEERRLAEEAIAGMLVEYRRRRDAALAILRESQGPALIRPEAAFYLFLDVGTAIPGDPNSGTTFAGRLLQEEGVAVVPGAAFRAPKWIRVSYAAAFEEVIEGVRRITALWERLRR